jgi:23S rRNA (guanine2445-N2)-methyltransferase / 23S rRNA (guanine2069-N7)-methyltransferase
VQLNVSLRENKATIAIDLSGEPLHRRGYRVSSQAIKASLRESIAATMLLAAGWGSADGVLKALGSDHKVAPVGDDAVVSPEYLIDPLCGSGTIAIEAALMLSSRAPGLLRDYWGFSGWLGHDPELWKRIVEQA